MRLFDAPAPIAPTDQTASEELREKQKALAWRGSVKDIDGEVLCGESEGTDEHHQLMTDAVLLSPRRVIREQFRNSPSWLMWRRVQNRVRLMFRCIQPYLILNSFSPQTFMGLW